MTGSNPNELYEWLQGLYVLVAAVTGTVLGWFLSQIKWVKPKLVLNFEGGAPCIRANIIRLKCENVGRVHATNCEAKLIIYDSNDVLVQDGLILHWSRLMILPDQGSITANDVYRSITIPAWDHEFIDFAILAPPTLMIGANAYWGIYCYPFLSSISSSVGGTVSHLNIQEIKTADRENQIPAKQGLTEEVLRAQIKVYADWAKPANLDLYLKVTGNQMFIGRTKASLQEVKTCK